MFEREAKQAMARIREVGVAIWRMELVSLKGVSFRGLSGVFFFQRQLLSLLLSFFSAAPVVSRSRCNSDQ